MPTKMTDIDKATKIWRTHADLELVAALFAVGDDLTGVRLSFANAEGPTDTREITLQGTDPVVAALRNRIAGDIEASITQLLEDIKARLEQMGYDRG